MKVIPGITLMLLLISCSDHGGIPFEVDTVQGSCRIRFNSRTWESVELKANGQRVLEGAFLFREKDSLLAINSLDGLDIITVFKGDSARGSVQLVLVNPGEENQEIRSVELVSTGQEEIYTPSAPGGLWDYHCESAGDSLYRTLDLSGSSIVLLPEERLSLPPIEFFFHLCPD